jgi:hypothetical protein
MQQPANRLYDIMDLFIQKNFNTSDNFNKAFLIHCEVLDNGIMIESIEFIENPDTSGYTQQSDNTKKTSRVDILVIPNKNEDNEIEFYFKQYDANATETYNINDKDIKIIEKQLNEYFINDIKIMNSIKGGTDSNTESFDSKIYFDNFIHLINNVLNEELIYKLSTLDNDEREEIFGNNTGTLLNDFKNAIKTLFSIDVTKFKGWLENVGISDEVKPKLTAFVYKYLNKTKTEVNILNFVFLIKMFLSEFKKNKLGTDTEQKINIGIVTLIHYYLNNNFNVFWGLYQQIKVELGKSIKMQIYIDFESRLKNKLEEKSKNSIITYLKIRNDNHNDNDYNKSRFKIFHNEEPSRDTITKLLVHYNSNNEAYKNPTEEQTNSTVNKYMFGEFTNIFLPSFSNKEISDNMGAIVDKLVANVPVFMLGYGASGAGKTSSLIYYKNAYIDAEKDGVLIHLCNKMAASGYAKIELDYSEYYYKLGENNTKEEVEAPAQSKTLTFTYNNGKFILDADYEHVAIHPYRMINMKPEYIKTSFKSGTPLGELIIHLVDTDRFVKATTNNPNSSRSHTLVFIKLLNDTTSNAANLVVGDFAGVENVFDCANPQTLEKFMRIKREDKGSKNDGKPFYSTNSAESGVDPIDQTDKAEEDIFIKSMNETAPVYDFDSPTIRKNFPPSIISVFLEQPLESMQEFNGLNDNIENQTKETSRLLEIYVTYVRKCVGAVGRDWPPKEGNGEWKNIEEINDAYSEQNKTESKGALLKLKQVHEIVPDYNAYIKKFLSKRYKINYDSELAEATREFETINQTKANSAAKIAELNAQIKTNMAEVNDKYNGMLNNFFDMLKVDKGELNNRKKYALDLKKHPVMFGVNSKQEYRIQFIKEKFADLKIQPSEYKGFESSGNVIAPTEHIKNYIELIEYLRNKEETKKNAELQSKIAELSQLDESSIKSKITELEENNNALKATVEQLINSLYENTDVNTEYELNSETDGNVKKVKPIDVLTEIKKELGLLSTMAGPTKLLDNLSIKLQQPVTLKSLIDFFTNTPEYSDNTFNNIHNVFDTFYDLIKSMDIERFYRMKGINQICNNRVIEGQFINDSLFKVRETIKTILKEKNKGKNISPLFVDECFEQYCPNHEYCFTSESEERERIIKEAKETATEEQVTENISSTILFTDIFGKIHSKLYQGSEISINEMYKNIVVSVFCVFNISPGANNPPPVPYIDINNLKYIYQYLMVGQNYSPELKTTLTTELGRIHKLITVDFNDKVNDLVIARILDNKGLFSDLKQKVYIVTAIKFIIDNIQIKGGFNIANTKGLIRQFIELIDNSNAISAIGTLEFLDQLAKFNRVTNVCRIDTNYVGKAAAYGENKMTELYA